MPVQIGPRIGITGESEYRRQINNIISQTKKLNAETKQMESSWNKDTTAKQKAAQQTQMLNQQIEAQKRKIEEITNYIEKATEEEKGNETQMNRWREALANANTELNRLESELEKVPNSLEIAGQQMQDFGDKVQSVGGHLSTTGDKLTRNVTAPLMAIGGIAVKTTADFDSSMSKVAALSGATGEEFETLRQTARDLGSTTRFSASEAADALSYMALAGYSTEDMLVSIDGVLQLAAASGMDLAAASDLVTDYLSAFGLEAEDATRMADELAYAQANSNTTTIQLGEAFGNSAAQMHTAGQTMETTTAILEALANQGLKGSEAGTALSAIVRDITQKMEDGKIMIGDTAVAVTDAEGNFRNLIDILGDVEDATDGMGSAEKSAALMTTFTARSVKGVSIALTEGTDNIKDYEEELGNADGSAQNMAETMQDNLSGQLTMLKSELQELAISFGDVLVPEIRKGVSWISKQVEAFSKLDRKTKAQIVKYAALAAAIGPVLTIGGKLTTGVGKMVSTIGNLLVKIGASTAAHTANATAAAADAAAHTANATAAAADAAATEAATAAQEGYNLSLLAGPAIGVAAGLAIMGIATAASLYAWKTHEARSEQEEFSLGLRNLGIEAKNAADELSSATDTLAGVRSGATDTAADMEASAALARRYADELITLSEKSNRTAEEQRQMEAVLDSLKEIYPSFNANIDEATGNLSMNTDEINKNIDALEKQAKAQAYQEAYKEIIEGVVEAEKKKIKAQMKADDLAKQLGSDTAAGTRFQEAFNKAVNEYVAQGMSQSKAEEKVRNGYVELNGEFVRTTEAMKGVANAEGGVRMQQADLNKEMEKADEEIAAASEEAERYRQAAEELGIEIPGLTDAVTESGDAADGSADSYDNYAGSAEGAADAILTSSDEIAEAYDKEYKSALNSLKPTTGLFEEMSEQSKISLDEMAKNLEDHVNAMRNWDSNMSIVMNDARYGTDEAFTDLINTLAAAGPESAPYLQALVDEMDTNQDAFNSILENYADKEALDASIADMTATGTVGLENGLAEMDQALDSGMTDTNSTFTRKAAILSSNVDAAGRVWSQKSTKGGAGIPKSAGQAIDFNSPIAVDAAGRMVNAVDSTTQTGLSSAASSANTEGGNISSGAASGIDSKSDEAGSAAERMTEAARKPIRGLQDSTRSWGEHAGQNFADGIGSKAEQARIKANAVAQAAANILKHSTPKEGPLKDDDVWGVHLAENFADGIIRGIPMVERATDNLALATQESLMVDPDLISGRSVMTASIEHTLLGSADMIYDAIVQGMNGVKFQIDRREFQRILHDVGVATA